MTSSLEKIYIDSSDEITSVIEQLRGTKGDNVAIVVPKEANLLQSLINLKLLKHQAGSLGKKINIVTTDKLGRNLAEKAGLIANKNLVESTFVDDDENSSDKEKKKKEVVSEEKSKKEEKEDILEGENIDLSKEEEKKQKTRTLGDLLLSDDEDNEEIPEENQYAGPVLNDTEKEEEDNIKDSGNYDDKDLDSSIVKNTNQEEDVYEKEVPPKEKLLQVSEDEYLDRKKNKRVIKEEKPFDNYEKVKKKNATESNGVEETNFWGKNPQEKNEILEKEKEEENVSAKKIMRVDDIAPTRISRPYNKNFNSLIKERGGNNLKEIKEIHKRKNIPKNPVYKMDKLKEDLGFKKEKAINTDKKNKIEKETVKKKSDTKKIKKVITVSGNIFNSKTKKNPKESIPAKSYSNAFISKTKKVPKPIGKNIYMRKKTQKKEILPKKAFSLIYVFLIGFLLIFLLGVYFIYPSSEIYLYASSLEVSSNMDLVAKKNPSIEGEILYKEFNFQETLDIKMAVVGENQGGNKATGKLKILNNYSEESQKLVATTRFESATGLIYRLESDVVIPGMNGDNPGLIEVSVVADQVGDKYNITSGSFKIPGFEGTPKYEKYTVSLSGQMSGGSNSSQKVISTEDINKLEAEIIKKSNDKIKVQIGEDDIFIEDEVDVTYDRDKLPKLNESAENIEISLPVEIKLKTISYDDLFDVSSKIYESKHLSNEKLVKDTIDYKIMGVKEEGDNFSFNLSISGKARSPIEFDDEIKKQIKGKRESDAENFIKENIKNVDRVEIKINPDWMIILPQNSNKIEIVIGEE